MTRNATSQKNNTCSSVALWAIPEGRTVRINYDQSLAPTLLLHLGAGVQRYRNPDAAPASISSYDEAGLLGIKLR